MVAILRSRLDCSQIAECRCRVRLVLLSCLSQGGCSVVISDELGLWDDGYAEFVTFMEVAQAKLMLDRIYSDNSESEGFQHA